MYLPLHIMSNTYIQFRSMLIGHLFLGPVLYITHAAELLPQREIQQNELLNWFGDHADKLNMTASVSFPLPPRLETGTVLVWKKTQMFSPAGSAFIRCVKEYLDGLHSDP